MKAHGGIESDVREPLSPSLTLVGEQHDVLLWRTPPVRTGIEKKQYFLPHMEEHTNNNEAYTGRSKCKGNKVEPNKPTS